MTVGPAELRPVTEDDWNLWRDLRLRVLATDPDAFGSTLERERSFAEADWRHRLRSGLALVASLDGRPVGMGAWSDHEPGVCSIVAMWVDPRSRGRGIGSQVLTALLATVPAGADVRLWVADGNPARDLYTREGFVASGEVAALRPGSAATKSRMVWTGSRTRKLLPRPTSDSTVMLP
jgi:GNAT superfamily N-acetyltransferase